METKINRGIVLRLAKYLRVLHKLKSLGFVKVFSNNLGDAIGVTPAVVRKDFSTVGIPGNKRGGYNIDLVIGELEKVLGKEDQQEVIVIGCGRIGRALIEFAEFNREGIAVAAGFDVNPAIINRNAPIPILPMEELSSFAKTRGIHVAILAVPDQTATAVFEEVIQAEIGGVLNFTSVDLKCAKCDYENCPVKCVIQNVNIGLEIENLFYLVRMQQQEKAAAAAALAASAEAAVGRNQIGTMTLIGCADLLEARLVAGGESIPSVSVERVIVSDLMSDVLLTEDDGFLLVTSLASDQVVRTADIVGAAAILLCNGKNPSPTMVELSSQNEIPLLVTALRKFEACRSIISCLESSA